MNIKEITSLSIEKYLLLSFWERDYEFRNEKLMVFNYKDIKIAIPSSEKYDDFYLNLEGILKTISIKENRSTEDILKDISSSYFDRLEFRIISNSSQNGQLPLGYAYECIEGLKDLVLYSICAEEKIEPICYRSTLHSKVLLDNFKLAQTEIGSYIFNIETMVTNETYEQLSLDDYNTFPLEHKVVKRISIALKQIDDVANSKEDINSIVNTSFQDGLTANMCDSLLKLKSLNETVSIETHIRYATSITKKIGDSDKILLESKHFYYINELSKKFREKEQFINVEIKGVIRSLKKDSNHDGHLEKTVSILTLFENRYRTIKLELSDENHLLACDAYRDEKEVIVSGKIDISGRHWFFLYVESFIVL